MCFCLQKNWCHRFKNFHTLWKYVHLVLSKGCNILALNIPRVIKQEAKEWHKPHTYNITNFWVKNNHMIANLSIAKNILWSLKRELTLIIFPSVGRYAGRFPRRNLVCNVLKFVSSMPFSSTLGGFSLLL